MSKTLKVSITGAFEFRFDPKSEEFMQSLESFKSLIDSSGDEEDMLKHVAYNLVQFGATTMVEGVGYVKVNGKLHDEPFCGIEINSGEPDFYYDVE